MVLKQAAGTQSWYVEHAVNPYCTLNTQFPPLKNLSQNIFNDLSRKSPNRHALVLKMGK